MPQWHEPHTTNSGLVWWSRFRRRRWPSSWSRYSRIVDSTAAQCDVKKTYVGATHDRAVPPALQRVLAERAGAAFQMIDSDHSPFYSARADLIRILLDHG